MKARDVKPGLLSWRGTLVSKTIMGQYLRVSDGVFVVIPDEDIVYPVEAVANADLFGVSAAVIAPSMTTWVVTCKHGHRTLELGDEVRMVEDPEYRNWLLRLRDSTMHRLQDTSGQYLLLKMKP